jgi:hypothetical protein
MEGPHAGDKLDEHVLGHVLGVGLLETALPAGRSFSAQTIGGASFSQKNQR